MRQAGMCAAACLYALDHNVERLAEDHANARRLAEGLAEMPQVDIDVSAVETNIIFFGLKDPGLDIKLFAQALADEGLLVLPLGAGRMRAVTHFGIEREHIDEALRVVERSLAAGRSGCLQTGTV
jgi:threonine aldolase